jgi:DNA-binding HxlR family transcriptional regulator
MHRKRLDEWECPVARALDAIGEWWSLLLVRDALRGLSRFDEFQESLGIARNMLSRRLRDLVARGIFERSAYTERPRRYEYRLTEKGEALLPVVAALLAWGNRWAAPPGGAATILVERASGQQIEPRLSAEGAPLAPDAIRLAAGPGAGAETRAAFALLRRAARRREAAFQSLQRG